MGPEQAGSVVRTVAEAKMARLGSVNEDALNSLENDTVSAMKDRSGALVNTARVWDDGIIDPRDTREILSFLLSICRDAKQTKLSPNTFGISRF